MNTRREWLAIDTLPLRSGKLGISDPNLFPSSAMSVALAPERYTVSVLLLVRGEEAQVLAIRVSRLEGAARGEELGEVGVDFAQVGVCDLERCEDSAEAWDEAHTQEVLAALDTGALYGAAPWKVTEDARMPWVRPGFGDGVYPVYELVRNGERVGIEVVFTGEDDAEAPLS